MNLLQPKRNTWKYEICSKSTRQKQKGDWENMVKTQK